MSNSAFEGAVDCLIARALENVHTAIPGVVRSYSDGFADVEPVLSVPLADGRELKMPKIFKVPVVFPRTARFGMTFPVEPGDGVLLVFCERAIDDWIADGEDHSASDGRMFSLTDAVAIVGLFGGTKGTAPSSDSVEIIFDSAKIVMKADGTITMNDGALEIKA
jgi:hypothetical protein